MRKRPSLLLILLLLGTTLPLVGEAGAAGPPQFGMGFNADSIVPVSQRIPVYVAGDQLWLDSYYGQAVNISVYRPGALSNAIATAKVNPNNPSLIYTFGPQDIPGHWTVVVGAPNQPNAMVEFTLGIGSAPSVPKMNHYSIAANGTLGISFSASLGLSYLGQACLAGSQATSVGVVPYSSPLGTGAVSIGMGPVMVNFLNSPTQPSQSVQYFEFWMELYYPYAYASPNDPGQLATANVLAARTSSVTFQASSASNLNVSLTQLVHLRQGRYEVHAYFRSSAGVQLQPDTLLLQGGRWVWFSSCDSIVKIAPSFSVSRSLNTPYTTWPSGIYLVAFSYGIEGVRYVPIALNLTRISMQVAPFGGSLPGSVTVQVKQNPLVSNSTYFSGSLYLAFNSIPAPVRISVGYQGAFANDYDVTILSQHNSTTLRILFGAIDVTATSNGVGVPNVKLAVNSTVGNGKNLANAITPVNGTSRLYMLGGTYTLTVRSGGFVETQTVRVTPGTRTKVIVAIPYAPNVSLSYVLVGLAVFGVLLNLLTWGKLARRTRPSKAGLRISQSAPIHRSCHSLPER